MSRSRNVIISELLATCDRIIANLTSDADISSVNIGAMRRSLQPTSEACACGRLLDPTMRFCDACGEPLAATGATVRLACQHNWVVYHSFDTYADAMRKCTMCGVMQRPQGLLRGEWVYDPTDEQVCDVGYTACLPEWMTPNL